MSDVVIATFPTEPAVLSGQRLDVRTVFDNRGASPAEAPSRAAESPFLYVLRSQAPDGPTYELSQRMTDARRSPDRVAPAPLETEPIGAGKKFEYAEDIAEFSNEAFAPGDYWLTVRYNQAGLESPRSAVKVLPLALESLSSDVTVDHLSSFAAHRAEDGAVTLLQRESEVRDPREGDFTPRATLPAGGPVSVATSVDVAPAGNGRWLAWLRDGSLAAVNAWGTRITKTAEPIAAAGTLLAPGFQIGVGKALFGVVTADGRLETYVASAAGLAKGWSAELGSAATHARWNAQPDGAITVAWEEAETGRVMVRAFDASGGMRGAAHALTPGRPATWGLPATGAPTVWVIVFDGEVPVFARFPAGADREVTRLPELPGATAWDFNAPPRGAAAVIAIAGETLQAARLPAPAWRAVAPAPRASRLRAVSLDGAAVWAEWAEDGRGIRYAGIPR